MLVPKWSSLADAIWVTLTLSKRDIRLGQGASFPPGLRDSLDKHPGGEHWSHSKRLCCPPAAAQAPAWALGGSARQAAGTQAQAASSVNRGHSHQGHPRQLLLPYVDRKADVPRKTCIYSSTHNPGNSRNQIAALVLSTGHTQMKAPCQLCYAAHKEAWKWIHKPNQGNCVRGPAWEARAAPSKHTHLRKKAWASTAQTFLASSDTATRRGRLPGVCADMPGPL